MNNRLIKSNDAGGGACTNTVDLYNPFPDGGGVALYQLNGDATDVSGNYNGTASNVTWGGAGVFGTSANMKTLQGNIVTPVGVYSNSFSGHSVSFWMYSGGTDYETAIWTRTADIVAAGWGIRVGIGGNSLTWFWQNNANSFVFVTEITGTFTDGWHHIVACWDGTTNTNGAKLYVDGNLSSQLTANATLASQTFSLGLTLGADRQSAGRSILGLDQVRIFNRALRPYEVEALYTEEYCTPTIVPSEHFNTVLYTGDGVDNRAVSNVGFAPDFVWVKNRDDNFMSFVLQDTIRGAGQSKTLDSTGTSYEGQYGAYGYISSFEPNGFTVVDGLGNHTNTDGKRYVSWNFKAGGAAVTNTDGTITSQVSANTEAGFSVVKFTGSLTSGQTVGHGLTEAPSVVILKDLDSVANWYIYHQGTGTTSGYINYLRFDATAGDYSDKIFYPINFNSSTFTPGNDETVLQGNVIAYCFAEVEGFSNFGSYVGNDVSTTVVTGFEPAFVMVKNAQSGFLNSWVMLDNKRQPTNPKDDTLYANLSNAESTQSFKVNFLENGFEVTTGNSDVNANGAKYIYMAFAADPTAVEPTLEDSFNTVTWSADGTSGDIDINGVGFQPDLVWAKARTQPYSNALFDSIRGVGGTHMLFSDSTNSESTNTANSSALGSVSSFNVDGFTGGAGTSGNAYYNETSQDYVAWNWKGAEIPAINSNGSIPSVVSSNPAAGFSIVSYTGNLTASTVGHGLNNTPSIYIVKSRDNTSNWFVYSSSIGNTKYLNLDSTIAASTFNVWNNTDPNDSVFSLAGQGDVNANGLRYIAYCFAEVAGFSKFGSYNGTGVNGNFIATGFEPAFVMVKRTNAADNWVIVDNKRGTSNSLFPDSSSQELSNSGAATFSSTGFTVNGASGGWNNASSTYIYMAFANQF